MIAEATPRVSAELFVIPWEDRFLVYAPLRRAAFVTTAGVVNRIADLQEGIFDSDDPQQNELVDFLRRLSIVDGKPEIRPITQFVGDPTPTTVTLFLTTACNLRCTYCYAEAGDTPLRMMSLETAKRGIDFIVQNAIRTDRPLIEVAYHGGGEPTVNWATLTGSYEYAKGQAEQYGLEFRAGMASNGFITDPDKVDWIVSHLHGVSVSFDGLPEVHDAHRVSLLGGGSASQVMTTLKRMEAASFHYALRMTVTRENIPQLEASVRFICQNFRPDRIQVEPAYQLGRWREAPSAETAEFISQYRAAQSAAREFGQEIQFSGARVGSLTNHFCGVTQDNFCLTADGEVSGCFETFLKENPLSHVFFYGDYAPDEKTFRFNLPILQELRNQSVDHHDYCQGCFAKWSCGGDCFHKSLTVNGPGEFQGSDRCHIIRELTKDQILSKIEHSGGLAWHDPPTHSILG